MARMEQTVFISYRRADVYTALAVYENLKNQGYDVFFDYRSIHSGDFEQIIASNIRARAHFLLILTPTALDRCNEPGDWLRREIELAMDEKRNIVPLFFEGFRFGSPAVTEKLIGRLKNVSRYNGINVHEDYFDEAMRRLATEYLNVPLETILHPVSTEVQKVVREEQVAVDKALAQKNIEDFVKQVDGTPTHSETVPRNPVRVAVHPGTGTAAKRSVSFNLVLAASIAGGSFVLCMLIWGASKFLVPLILATPEPTQTFQTNVTSASTSQPITATLFELPSTDSPVPSDTVIAPTTVTESGTPSTLDGMTLLYVPAGAFTMGSDKGDPDEKPIHKVYLDSFWIDQTEVTNKMYAACVAAGTCTAPRDKSSSTREQYYGASDFDNYPVINVAWSMASTYCEWAGRRLPTEAEWEKAARGTDALIYPWGNGFDGTKVNFCDKNCPFDWADRSYDDGFADTAPVNSYPKGASPYGALNMAGNVWEWVADWYSDSYYANSPERNPLGPELGELRALRGGSWYYYDYFVTTSSRFGRSPDYIAVNFGFRCAMNATP